MISNYTREGYLNEDYHYFHLRDTAGQERDFHFHEFNKLVILLSGRVDYMVENATYTMKPWDVLLIGHHVIHKALIDKSVPYERVILYLDRDYPPKSREVNLSECFEIAERQSRHMFSPKSEERKAISFLLQSLDKTDGDDAFASATLRDTLVTQLLISVNRAAIHAGESQQARPAYAYDEKIADTLTYIHENIASPLTVELLSDRVYLSRYHFMRLFKSQTGATVHSYIRQHRLLHAAQLIRQGVNINKAAFESGFDDYSTFYRAFRDCFGFSPRKIK